MSFGLLRRRASCRSTSAVRLPSCSSVGDLPATVVADNKSPLRMRRQPIGRVEVHPDSPCSSRNRGRYGSVRPFFRPLVDCVCPKSEKTRRESSRFRTGPSANWNPSAIRSIRAPGDTRLANLESNRRMVPEPEAAGMANVLVQQLEESLACRLVRPDVLQTSKQGRNVIARLWVDPHLGSLNLSHHVTIGKTVSA